MTQYSDEIKRILQTIFTAEKIRLDLFDYLNEAKYVIDNEGRYCISVSNIQTNIPNEELISPEDDIHIIKFVVDCDLNTGLRYYLILGIGKYVENVKNAGLFTIEKCLVELSYNPDLSLYDVEFYMESLHKQLK